MEELDDKLIERYYLNDLSEAELAGFNRRMAEDEEFWEAVQLHADALEAIRLEGIALLRKRLAAKGRELDAVGTNQPASRWLWWLIGLAVVMLGVWALWWWIQPEITSPPVPVIESRDLTPSSIPDTLPALPPSEKQLEPAQKTPNYQRIFAAWFQPYKDPSLEPVRRGDAERSPSERFQLLYWEGDYGAALVAFDALGASAKNNDNLLFLKANCLLEKGKAAEAGTILENMERNGRSRFKAQVPWYLALARLQSGSRDEAQTLLRRIAADPALPRRSDAERVLQDLK